MHKRLLFCFIALIFSLSGMKADNLLSILPEQYAPIHNRQQLLLRTNVVPWTITIPNIGLEYKFKTHWSAAIDFALCPWKLSDNFSVKTYAILPEARYWLKNHLKGSYFDFHASVAWYNVRYHSYRYQDSNIPLLGCGVGYGYRLNIKEKWGVEFSIGAGFFRSSYERYYNIPNGALADRRKSTYFGIDRVGISFTYKLADL